MKYVKVCEEEDEPSIELPLEEDNTLLLSTLACQFTKATGLKYKSKDSGIYRGVRFASDRFFPPPEGWETFVYSCVLLKDNKRKGDDDSHSIPKTKKIDNNKKCTDLIVLNIPWRTDDEALRMYFSKFGEVVMVQVKREPDTMKSKGYAFIRFAEYDAQVMCLAEQHCIDNRWCEVKIPYSKMAAENSELRNKIHVGRLSEAVTADVLRSFFNQYGKVESIYIPRPFRSFAFVTFEDESTPQSLLGRELKINDDCVVTISAASPKINHTNNQKTMNGSHQGYGHWNSYEVDEYGSPYGLLTTHTDNRHHSRGGTGGNNRQNMMSKSNVQPGNPNSGMMSNNACNSSPHQLPHHPPHPPHGTADWPTTAFFPATGAGHHPATAAFVAAANRHHHHGTHGGQQANQLMSSSEPYITHAMLAAHQVQAQLPPPPQAHNPYHPHPTAADINQNTTAMAALNIINNPSVVAAIMTAAAARASQHHPADSQMIGSTGPNSTSVAPTGNVTSAAGGYTSTNTGSVKNNVDHLVASTQSTSQHQQQQQFLYSQIAANQNSWGY